MRSRDRGGCGKPVSDYQPVLVAGAYHVCGGGAPVRGPGDGVAAAGGLHWRHHVPGSNMVSVPSVAFGALRRPMVAGGNHEIMSCVLPEWLRFKGVCKGRKVSACGK